MKLRSFSSSSSLCSQTPTWRERFRSRWQSSWWCERVEVSDVKAHFVPRGGMLGACRQERTRRCVAMLSLGAFLGSQCVLPGAFLLSEVHADKVRRTGVARAEAKLQEEKTPLWAKLLRAKIEKEKATRAARLDEGRLAQADTGRGQRSPLLLTQFDKRGAGKKGVVNPALIPVPGSKPGQVAPSQENGACEDCEVDVRALDLSRTPTERQLRRAGQLGGALSPLRPAEPLELEARLDAILKRSGIEAGLKADLPESVPNNPKLDRAGKLLARAKKKVRRAYAINQSFGEAIQEWNKHNYRKAAGMFEKHLKEFPESPWAGEAAIHLGCDAKYNGRFEEAQERYDALLQSTSGQKRSKSAEDHRPMRARTPEEAQRRLKNQVDELIGKSATPEAAVESADDQTDLSFEIHQKAKLRWADLNLAMGRFDDASQKLADIIQTDTDWRRITWARHWLRTTNFYKKNAPQLMACGPQALGVVLTALDKKAAANRVVLAVAPRATGFNLAELQTLARKNGTAMRGFKATAGELNKVPLPAILHYDWSVKNPTAKGNAKGNAKADAQAKSDPFRLAGGTGHFVVLHEVDAAKKTVRLFDPLERRFYSLSFEQLNRQWSGQGLAPDNGKTRLASAKLDRAAMEKAVGGCCGVPSAEDDLGDSPNNDSCGGGSGGGGGGGGGGDCGGCPCSDKGEPVIEINRATLNMYVHDTPLWYEPAVGPSVGITISYNSQDATTQHTPFGNKWMFNYGTYLVEDTAAGGGRVTVYMPDGSKDNYTPDGAGGYSREIGNFATLQKPTATSYVLTFQDGSRWVYDIPSGTTSLQVFLREVVDPFGAKLTFAYDANVRLSSITDAGGQITTLSYNAQNKVAKVWDPFGRHASFSYDGQGNLIECVDMEGQAFQYTYDSEVRITRLNTALGPWDFVHEGVDGNDSYYYPPIGAGMWDNSRLTVSNPAGAKEEYYYDGYHGRSWHVDHNGYRAYPGNGEPRYGSPTHRTDYFFTVVGGKGRLSQISYPDGTSVSMGYDAPIDAPNSVTDARGKTTTSTYNAQGRPLSVTDPKGNVSTLAYAPNGIDVTSVKNANGIVTATYTYNVQHQVTSATDRSGTTTYSYTPWGAPLGSVDPQGRASRTLYGADNRAASVEHADAPDANGNRVWKTLGAFTYDAVGRVKSTTDALGLTLGYEYNNLDALTKVTYPDGTTQETDYICCGLPGVVKDRAGRKSYTDYDAMKRVVRVQDAAGNALQIDYDKEGNRTRLIDAKGQITRWAYDAVGRVTQKKYHDGTLESSTYSGGVLSQSTGARGQVVNYAYDDNSNLSLIDYPNMADVSFSHNKLDDVTQVVDGVGTHAFSYDGYGRLNALDGPMVNDAQSFGYDAFQRMTGQSAERGASGGAQSQSYAYDALERLQTLTSSGTNGAGTFTYNYVGNTSMRARLDLPNGAKATQSYDALQRLTQVQNIGAGNVNLASYSYGYDNRDVKTGVQSQLGADPLKQIAYAYDAVDQLTGESATGGAANSAYSNAFTYDAMGNRTRLEHVKGADTRVTSSTPNPLNQLTAISTSQNGGAAQTSGLNYDVSGNLTQTTASDGSKTLYSYDDADRLIRLERQNATGAFTGKSEFVYDYASRKVVSREFTYTAGAWAQTNEIRRVFDDLDVIQERNAANEVTAQYVRDGNIGGILSRTSASGHSYFHYDGGGNVTALSSETGALVGRYSYDAFGNTLEASGTRAAENPYRFSTKEHIAGLVDFGYRFYSPGMGRWLNRDPIRESGGLNLYGMVGNNPGNAVDDYGLQKRFGGPFLDPNAWRGAAQAVSQILQSASRGATKVGDWFSRNPGAQQGTPQLQNTVRGPYGSVSRAVLDRAARGGGSTTQVFTNQTRQPSAGGRGLSTATGENARALIDAAGKARGGGQTYIANIPTNLLNELEAVGLAQRSRTLMGGAEALEIRFIGMGQDYVVPFFKACP